MSDITAKITSIDPEDGAKKLAGLTPVNDTTPDPLPEMAPVKTGMIWLITGLIALLWTVGVSSFFYLEFIAGREGAALQSWQMVLFTTLVLIPAIIILLLGAVVSRLAKLTGQTQNMLMKVNALSRPDETLKGRAESLAASVRSQLIAVDGELGRAMERLAGMENKLNDHVDALETSHLVAVRQGNELSERLSAERQALKDISLTFDERMSALSRMLSEQSERLSVATHTAEQKIQEARVSVEGAAAKINASSETVRDNASAAANALGDSQSQITALGDRIKALSANLDAMNTAHARDLQMLMDNLSKEQEAMSQSIEARLAKMREMSLSAQVSAENLEKAASAGQKTVEALGQSARLSEDAMRQRFSEMEDMVRYSNARAESISERAAKRVKDALALSRMEIGRIEEDMRALEDRLSGSLDAADRRNVVDVTPKPNWRKSLLRFRPLPEDDTPPSREETPTPPAPVTSPVEAAMAASSAPVAINVAGQQDMGFDVGDEKLALTDAADLGDVELDFSLTAPEDAPQDDAAPMELSSADIIADANPIVDDSPDVLELDMPQDAEEVAPIEAVVPRSLRRKSDPKKAWSWRSFLGGVDETEAKDIETYNDGPLARLSPEQREKNVLARLAEMGLDPETIVDGGCVIEAANARKFKGASKMREIVELRLPGPVAHLRQALENDPAFRADVDAFAVRYYQTLGNVENDRETLREALETQSGRAFILCDTALG